MYVDNGSFQNCSHHLLAPQQVSKRVCRNLTAEFCSETSAASEPNLDLWVLRTLGLKDRDTIDVSSSSSSSSGCNPRGFMYDAAVTSQSGARSSSFSSSVATSPPPSVLSYPQSSTPQTEYSYNTAEYQETDPAVADPAQHCSTSPGQCSDFTATGLTKQYDASGAVIRSYNATTAFQTPPTPKERPVNQLPEKEAGCSGQSQPRHSAYWSPLTLRSNQTPSQQDTFSPSGERLCFSPIPCPVKNHQSPVRGVNPTSPSAASQPPAAPQTPRSRTDLAFSMSLSPSSSVKTHSFPQGQAFVRKDSEGRWNFTWVPRQEP